MSRPRRVRALSSLLTAACLAVGMLAVGQPIASASSATDLAGTLSDAPAELSYRPADCNAQPAEKGYARCYSLVKNEPEGKRRAALDAPPATALGPADVKSAYQLPDGGQGQTVAIVDAYGNSHAEADLARYRSYWGLPECTSGNGCLRIVDQDGGTELPPDEAGWALETSLDLDAVSAACPACDILLVQADSANVNALGTAVNTAVRLGAKFVSNSYGISGEDPTESGWDHYYDHPGVAVTASTGDTGNVVNYPASDPNVVSVGGTKLTKNSGSSRGWDETVWAEGGSGCSQYEPQPAYQAALATGCANRATADISAVADPDSGLAVYDTLSQKGWLQVGGTSLSSPLMASMYALAGTPAENTYPATYPYTVTGEGLFDVTEGSNGTCGTVLCTAGTGWDGPTGLGTPLGVGALAFGPAGTVAGQVTNKSTGKPVPATVTLTNQADHRVYRATTDAQGKYSAIVRAGTYSVTSTAFGYAVTSSTGIHVAEGQNVAVNLASVALPTHRVTGKITDGSGHGWPLYAKIAIDGYPGNAIYTDPDTGAYSVALPVGSTYNFQVSSVYGGYLTTTTAVAVGTRDVRRDIAAGIETTDCTAAGYAYPLNTGFEGWSESTPQQGWTVDNGPSGSAWKFSDFTVLDNYTGAPGAMASVETYSNGGAAEDTSLVSPVLDLRHTKPEINFDSLFLTDPGGATATVDLSTDGGRTWATVQAVPTGFRLHTSIAIPQAAGQSDVRVRFHFDSTSVAIIQLDDIRVGSCDQVTGGLLTGTVSDANTGKAVNGATVVNATNAAQYGTSIATPDDAGTGDGFYWLFSATGRHTYTVSANRYTSQTRTAKTTANAVSRADIGLRAGHLKLSTQSLQATVSLGRATSRKLTLTNDGSAPLHVTIDESSSGFIATGSGTGHPNAARLNVAGGAAADLVAVSGSKTAAAKDASSKVTPAAASGKWTNIADYPEPIMDNAVGYHDGKVYSVGGLDILLEGHATRHGYVYDSATGAWTAIADLPHSLVSAAAAFVGETLYVVGGLDENTALATVYAYRPAKDSWSRVADLPVSTARTVPAVLGGKLYAIGGCIDNCSATTASVYRYDPAADTWTKIANYPTEMALGACAGVNSEIVCTGGYLSTPHAEPQQATYIYQPSTGAWTQAADLPYTDFGMAFSGANGKLQIVGGVTPNATGQSAGTNQAQEYDPVTNLWTALPNANYAAFRGGGSGCGLYQVGGSIGASGVFTFPSGYPQAETLAGYDQCGGDDVAWLSEDRTGIDLAPGQSVSIKVTLNAAKVSAPGKYSATLPLESNSPYTYPSVKAVMQVTRR